MIHAGLGWFGKGSVTSQPGEKKKKQPPSQAPKRKKKSAKTGSPISGKGNGLTRAEIVSRAEKKVRALEGEIKKTQRRLRDLEQELSSALLDSEKAKNLPSKTKTHAATPVPEKTPALANTAIVLDQQEAMPAKIASPQRVITKLNPRGAVVEHRRSRKIAPPPASSKP